jgi:hypothetical protein
VPVGRSGLPPAAAAVAAAATTATAALASAATRRPPQPLPPPPMHSQRPSLQSPLPASHPHRMRSSTRLLKMRRRWSGSMEPLGKWGWRSCWRRVQKGGPARCSPGRRNGVGRRAVEAQTSHTIERSNDSISHHLKLPRNPGRLRGTQRLYSTWKVTPLDGSTVLSAGFQPLRADGAACALVGGELAAWAPRWAPLQQGIERHL